MKYQIVKYTNKNSEIFYRIKRKYWLFSTYYSSNNDMVIAFQIFLSIFAISIILILFSILSNIFLSIFIFFCFFSLGKIFEFDVSSKFKNENLAQEELNKIIQRKNSKNKSEIITTVILDKNKNTIEIEKYEI